jgi:DNA polymerase-3 subunit delta'
VILALDDITGQELVVKVLRRSLATGKIAHAYLFEGLEGCGKKTTALAFIQALFCPHGEGCGQCPSCLKIAKQQHPDLILIEPDGAFIKIDQIRELQRIFSFHPYEAPRKACIIEDAEKMNPSAANALLKTLEEPPGQALMILLTTNSERMLPTVLSRCQKIPFSPLPAKDIETWLVAHDIPADRARVAASLAGGSLGKALEMEDDGILQERQEFIELVAGISLREIDHLFAAAERLSKDKENLSNHLEVLKTFLRDILLMKTLGQADANKDLLPLIEQESQKLSLEQVLDRIEHVNTTERALARNVNPRLALEVLLMELATA